MPTTGAASKVTPADPNHCSCMVVCGVVRSLSAAEAAAASVARTSVASTRMDAAETVSRTSEALGNCASRADLKAV